MSAVGRALKRALGSLTVLGLASTALVVAAAGALESGRADAPLPSGTRFISEELAARQRDPGANPGMLWIEAGAALWRQPADGSGRSCLSCHGEAADSMAGVAARYPVYDPDAGSLLNLEGRINHCRRVNLNARPLPYESDELLALTAFVARQSLGLPMDVAIDGPAAPYYQEGAAFFHRRQGQLNLSCANCHDQLAGRRLRGDVISHGLGNGFPIYRLEWQSLGSLHRRLRACSLGVRAVQFDFGSREYLGLELYLARRARGVAIETPAMRR